MPGALVYFCMTIKYVHATPIHLKRGVHFRSFACTLRAQCSFIHTHESGYSRLVSRSNGANQIFFPSHDISCCLYAVTDGTRYACIKF